MKAFIPPAPVRAFPHVSGQTRRVKSEPTKLSGVAARVMSASGNFSTGRGASSSSSGLWLGVLALVLAAGTIAVAGGSALTGDRASDRASAAAASPAPITDEAASLSAAERSADAAPSTKTPESAPPAMAEAALNSQDRFEISRFHRRTAAAASDLAPAAGPASR